MISPSQPVLGRFRRVFVATDDELASILPEISGEDTIGVDVEMGQRVERRPGGQQEWIHILALVQIAAGDVSVLIDPLRCSVTPLKDLMAGAARKVFLGGGQDAALLAKAGIPAVNIADVGEVALAIFGRREDGMAALARRIFGLSLDKTVRRADWMVRPINPTLLSYAHQDAELTLAIYRWFQENYPQVVRLHERRDLEEELPAWTPDWLRSATRSQVDMMAVLMERGLDATRDRARLSDDVRTAIAAHPAPRVLNRLLRVAGELNLEPLISEVLLLVESPSSLLRAAAARALGHLATEAQGSALLKVLAGDPISDVQTAAAAGMRDLKARFAPVVVPVEEEDEGPSLPGEALTALEELKRRLEVSE